MLRNEAVDIELLLLDLKGNVFAKERERAEILLGLWRTCVGEEGGVDHGFS